jgi:hypothetical protein
MAETYVRCGNIHLKDLKVGEIFEMEDPILKSTHKPKLYRLQNIFLGARKIYCFTDNEVDYTIDNPVVKRVYISKIEYNTI